MIDVTVADPYSPAAADLFRELAAFYAERYQKPGFGSFPLAQLTVPRAVFVVAWRDDEAIGCGAFRPMDDPDCAEVKRMFVRANARKQGVAQLILIKLERLAQEYGYKRIRLETGKLVPEAVRLYEAAGYAKIPCWGVYADREESVCFQKFL